MEETKLIKSRKKKYGPLFDSSDRWFKYKVSKKDFPFNDIGDEAIKLKLSPIEFRWPRTDAKRGRINSEGRPREPVLKNLVRGQIWNCRWFRSLSKVQIVLGILGPPPIGAPRVDHPTQGKDKVSGGSESDHASLNLLS